MFKQILTFFIKGFAMGSADLVPGISGATIALVLNIYHPFIQSIKRFFSFESLRLILSGQWKKFFNHIHLEFILPVVVGIFTCIFTLAVLIAYLLEHHSISFWSFFFGLILASALVLPDNKKSFSLFKVFLILLGIITGYLLISLNTLSTPDTSPMIFLAGMLAIGSMLLPGISGSFVLVLIDKYTLLIHAIKDLNIEVLSIFSLGAIVSLIILPRIIDFIFKGGKEEFILFISGFLIGSLNKIWPWRLTEPVTGKEISVSPSYYEKILMQDTQWLSAIFFALLGALLIFLIRYLEKRLLLNSDVFTS